MEILYGTRRKIYYYLLRQREPVSLRKIQRELNLSSPSLALYHLRKLEEMGLVRETSEGYTVKKLVLGDYIKVANILIPRSAFLASFFITSLILLWILTSLNPFAVPLFSSVIIAVPASIYIVDVVRKYFELHSGRSRED